LKQQVVEDMNQALKTGVHLKHVPYPDDYLENSDSEDENKENKSTENVQDLHTSQSSDDELFDKPIYPSKRSKTKKPQSSTPSIITSLWRFLGIIQIIPLILRCAFNTFLLGFISKIISMFGFIFARLDWFRTKIERFLPVVIVNVLQFCTNLVINLKNRLNDTMEAKQQENEDKIQKTYDIIVSYSQNLVREYQKIEDSIQDYTPTFSLRDNFNLFTVLSIRSFIWFTFPFIEYFRMRNLEKKKRNPCLI